MKVDDFSDRGQTSEVNRAEQKSSQPQVSKASAGKKSFLFLPLVVNLLEDGQGVTDITGPLLLS